ncbi:TPA: NUDIX domain-containing protein, partial [Escherichia coli]|nr:NUDIX domain-containing protein [Escherichia coli]
NYWFVPGGRILKDESFENAFKRVTLEELGVQISINEAKFLGAYEHFYSDNFSGTNFSTHYIVLGYEINTMSHQINYPTLQHSTYNWFDIAELLADSSVHQYTKNYFK